MKKTFKRVLAGFLAGMMLLTFENPVATVADPQAVAVDTGLAVGEESGTTVPEPQSEATETLPASQEAASQPESAPEVPSQPESTPEVPSQPEPTPEVVSQPEPTQETVSQPEPTQEAVSQPEPTQEAVSQPEPTQEASVQPEPTPKEAEKTETSDTAESESLDNDLKDQQMRETAIDWSSMKDYFRFRATQSEDNADDMELILAFVFTKTDEEYRPKTGDTAVLSLPDTWVDIENVAEPADVFAYVENDQGTEEALNIKIGEYTIDQGILELTFTEGIESEHIAEAMSEMYGKITIPYVWKKNVQKAYEQEITWTMQSFEDGTKNETVLHVPERAPLDWSGRKDEFLFDANTGGNAEEGYFLAVSFSFLSTQDNLMAQDTAELVLPVQWMNIENFTGDVMATMDLSDDSQVKISEFSIADGKMLMTFTDEAENEDIAKHMDSLKGCVKIPFSWKEEALSSAGSFEWVLQSYEDGTDHSVQIEIPESVQTKDETDTDDFTKEMQEEEQTDPVENGKGENTQQELSSVNAMPFAADEVSLGGYIFKKDTLKYNNEASRDIYWIDNNNGQQTRPTYAGAYLFNKLKFDGKFSYVNDNGETEEISFSGLSFDDAVLQQTIHMIDLGGTGHWKMTIQNILSEGALLINGKEYKGTFSEWSIQQDLSKDLFDGLDQYVPVLIADVNESGIPVDQNGRPRPGASDPQGWYYVQKTDYTADILVRSGTTNFTLSSLKKAIEQSYSFFWETGVLVGGQDVNSGSASLETMESWIDVEWEDVNQQLTGKVTVNNLEKYNLDGSEMIYYVDGDNNQDVIIRVVGSADQNELTDGDYIAESVENNSVGNWGTNTTEVHNGGKLILTLTGYTDYNAAKEWHDEADPSQRPKVDFYLWRFTQKENTDLTTAYQTAAPVKATEDNPYGEVGQTAVYSIPEKSADDKTEFDFSDSFEEAEGSAGYLPKYDPEGYNYVYLAREYMGEGSERYKTEYGSLNIQTDTFEDTLPYNGSRERQDNSIYDEGTVSNILTGTTGAGVEKTWIADAFQSELSDVVVELTLQSRPVQAEQDDEENWKNTAVTYRMGETTPFIAEFLNQSYSTTLPKYNNSGQELEYRWIESGVYQGGGTDNLLQPDGTFLLDQRGQKVAYTSKVTVSKKDTFYTSITNEIEDKTDYYLEKIWEDGIEPRAISLILYRTNSVNEQQRISTDPKDAKAVFTMDGTADEQVTSLYYQGRMVGQVQETSPWYAEFTELEKYDTDGSQFDYFALEETGGEWTVKYGATKDESGKVIHTITNGPIGQSQEVLLRKRWLDDGDEQHRGAVTFTLYEIPDGVTEITNEVLNAIAPEKVKNVTISRDHDWWEQVSVPISWNLDSLLVLETSVASVDAQQEPVLLSYTEKQLNEIFKLQHGDGTAEGNGNSPYVPYETEYHRYEAGYSMVTLEENNIFYTVTNRRLGNIDIEVTKNWVDGSKGVLSENRKNLLEYLDDQGYELVFKLEGASNGDSDQPEINYEKNTVTFGSETVPILDKEGKPTEAVQLVDTENNTSVYYFYNLPKYDLYGRLVSYRVKEMLKDTESGEIMEISKVLSGDKTQDYTFSITQSGYTVTHGQNDRQTFAAVNALSGEKEVFFWKEWNDAYRNRRGERPDIYLSLYQLEYDENGKEIFSPVYLDRRWTFTDNSVSYCDFGDMPKYDGNGNEIIYYAQEKIMTDKKAFDYRDVYYKYDQRLENTEISNAIDIINGLSGIGDEKGPANQQNPDQLLYDHNGTWLLKEYGVFVNELEAKVLINGKKIWANVPLGFLDVDLPHVEFKLYQFSTNDLDGSIPDIPAEDADPSEYEDLNPYATLKITDWKQQKINGEYLFTLAYEGKNTNEEVGDEMIASPENPASGKLPKYDEEGFLYEYRLREAADISGTDAAGEIGGIDLVYKQPTINNYAITNPYDSSLGEIRVIKYLETEAFTDGSEPTLPSVSFKLTRKYKGSDGGWKEEESYKNIRIIGFEEFQNGKAELVFDNLEIYAPNGNKYVYTIEENPTDTELIQGGYKVYSGSGKLEKEHVNSEGKTVTNLYPMEVSGGSIFKLDPKADEENAWATFKNVYTQDKKDPLYLGKKWEDARNREGVRPKTLTFEIKRSADAQPGSSNAIGAYSIGTLTLTIIDDSSWNAKDVTLKEGQGLTFSENSYLATSQMIEQVKIESYAIGDTLNVCDNWVICMENMEVYAPNGMPWKYTITETNVDSPYTATAPSAVFTYDKKQDSYSWRYTAGTRPEIVNSMSTNTTLWKNWRCDVDDFGSYPNPYGYTVELTTQLFAAGVEIKNASEIPADDQYNQEELWRPVVSGYSNYSKISSYYKWLNPDITFDPQKTISVSSDAILKGKVSAHSVSYDALPRVIKTESGLLYMKYYVMETGVILKNEAGKEIYKETFTPTIKEFSQKGNGYQGESRLGFWLEPQAQICQEGQGIDTEKLLFTPVVSSEEMLNEIHDKGLKSVYTGNKDLVTDESLYPYINFDSEKRESTFVNLYELTKLDVEKTWKNDSDNIYGSRESSGSQWKLKFILQRKDKDDSSAEAWKTVMNGSTPKSITISGDNRVNQKTGTFTQLPVMGLEAKGNGSYAIMEYDYRAREAVSASSSETVEPNGTYRGSYQVTYTDPDSTNPDKMSVVNTMQTIDLHARKTWTGPFKDTVTFELKYTKEDGSLASFATPAKVTLNGEKDGATGAYYEKEVWQAVWKGVPKIVPGSKTTGTGDEEQTVYTIVETSQNSYGDAVTGNGTEETPFVINNELTKLRVEKQVEIYADGASEDREFTFTLKGDLSGISVNYKKYQKADAAGADTEITGEGGSLTDSSRTFQLQDGQYVLIYGLKKGTRYTITESDSGSYVPYYQVGTGEPSETSAQVIVPVQKTAPEETPNIVVTNRLFGKLTVKKVDEKDNPLAGVTFALEKKEKSSDPGAEESWKPVQQLTTAASGTVVFEKLELNVDYRIQEVYVPEGYVVLGEPMEIHLPLETDRNESGSTPIYTLTSGNETRYYFADVTVTIGNHQPLVMPTTSGRGFFWPGLIGFAMLAAGGGYCVYTWGRKRKKSS